MSDVIMERDGARTEVHPGSVATMQWLGWRIVDRAWPRNASPDAQSYLSVAEANRILDAEAGVQPGDQIAVKPGKDGPVTTNVHQRDLEGVPADWRALGWPQRRSLAKRLSPREPIRNDVDAHRVIEAHLARRP
jgi:hypothetical protein